MNHEVEAAMDIQLTKAKISNTRAQANQGWYFMQLY